MAKYTFPAIFKVGEEGYRITFPDLPHCITHGRDLESAYKAAIDELFFVLYHMEDGGWKIPYPTAPKTIIVPDGAFISMVDCDTTEYRKFYSDREIEKWKEKMVQTEIEEVYKKNWPQI